MTDQGILSEFTGSEYMFKILQEVDGGKRGGGYLKVMSRMQVCWKRDSWNLCSSQGRKSAVLSTSIMMKWR